MVFTGVSNVLQVPIIMLALIIVVDISEIGVA